MTTSSFRAMAINAFFLGLRMANRWNLSLKNEPFIREAAHETCTKIERRYLLPLVVAVLLYLPALSSFLGRNPAQPTILSLLSKTLISPPVSAIMVIAATWLIPGMVCKSFTITEKCSSHIRRISDRHSDICTWYISYSCFAQDNSS